jgi:hypothetical protein
MRLSGFLVLICFVLLQSCGGVDESFDESTGFSKEQLEQGISLNFSEEAFSEVTRQRNEALAVNYHFKEKEDFVPGLLSCGQEAVKVKVRLKGGEVDHLSGKMWSYKLKGKKNLGFGQKKLAIQSPHTKNHLHEFLFHKLCSQEGIIALEYFFVPVTINDSLKSSYAMATVIGSQTLKNSGRKVGPILKFAKKAYWKKMVAGETRIDSTCMLSAQIKPCNTKWSKKHNNQYSESVTKLNQYRQGQLLPNKVFDYDLFARYVAVSELLGSSHNLRWLNLRLYYHPKTHLFEPIAFDCFDGMDPRNEIIWYNEKKRFEYFLHPLLDDLNFQSKVEDYLRVYCSQDYVKAVFSDNHAEIAKYLKLIRRDKPNYILSRNQMLKRAKYILSTLN